MVSDEHIHLQREPAGERVSKPSLLPAPLVKPLSKLVVVTTAATGEQWLCLDRFTGANSHPGAVRRSSCVCNACLGASVRSRNGCNANLPEDSAFRSAIVFAADRLPHQHQLPEQAEEKVVPQVKTHNGICSKSVRNKHSCPRHEIERLLVCVLLVCSLEGTAASTGKAVIRRSVHYG